MPLNTLKSAVKTSLYWGGAYHARRTWAQWRHPGPRLVILVYHNLTPSRDYSDAEYRHFSIRPELIVERFDLHMKALRELYPVLSLQDGLTALHNGSLMRDTAIITFDDGYKSFKELALPVLRKWDLPATVFLATDFIGADRFYWWDELNQIVYHLWQAKIPGTQVAHATNAVPTESTFDSASDIRKVSQFLEHLEGGLRYATGSLQHEIVGNLRELLPIEYRNRLRPEPTLSWHEVRDLLAKGITFGSHTCSHFNFAEVSLEQMEDELKRSKEAIESKTEQPVYTFAYPYGGDYLSYTRAHTILQRLGYHYARTTRPGYNDVSTDPLMLNSGAIGALDSTTLMKRDLALGFVR